MIIQPCSDRRSVVRKSFAHGALLFFQGQPGARGSCLIDISYAGFRLGCPRLTVLPITFQLTFNNFVTVQRCSLVWRNRDVIGATFER